MSESNTENEIGSILITRYVIDENIRGVSIDISLQKEMIEILNIQVSMDEDYMAIHLPENFDRNTGRDFITLKFIDPKRWMQIKSFLKDQIQKRPWLMVYLGASES